ncbi:hypothetical protein G6F58_013425 [Rhizopus delemar]|nr:hypothetical protein G6F58_013425 [Rhizopus delemar]
MPRSAVAVAVAVAVALDRSGCRAQPCRATLYLPRDCLPCPRSAGCAAAGRLQRRCRLDRAAALAVPLRTGLRHSAACGARAPWPAVRGRRLGAALPAAVHSAGHRPGRAPRKNR